MSGTRLSRRQFMARAAVVGALLATPLAGLAFGRTPAGPLHLVAELRGSRSARRLGRIYLGQAPTEASIEAIGSTLCGAADDHGERCVERIRDLIARDFRTGDIVMADGWLISRTEARLFALAALAGT